MSCYEDQAQQFRFQAEKKLSSRSLFSYLFTSSRTRMEDAINLYQKAGNYFKLAKNWIAAGDSYKNSATLNRAQNNAFEAAQDYFSAAKCYEKWNSDNAISLLFNAIDIYTELGRFILAAKLHYKIAEIYENTKEINKAMQHFEQAAHYFKTEELHTYATKSLSKVATYAAIEGEDYIKAASIFEEMASYDIKSHLQRYNANDDFFKAALCQLCVDCFNAKHIVNTYIEKWPAFSDSREYAFLCKIIDSIEDEDKFSVIVKEFDAVSRLDTWKLKILLKIKNQIKEINLV